MLLVLQRLLRCSILFVGMILQDAVYYMQFHKFRQDSCVQISDLCKGHLYLVHIC